MAASVRPFLCRLKEMRRRTFFKNSKYASFATRIPSRVLSTLTPILTATMDPDQRDSFSHVHSVSDTKFEISISKATPHALDLSIVIKNNMDNKRSAGFSAMIVGARRFLSIKLCGAVGAKAGSDG